MSLFDMYSNVKINSDNRRKNDFYPTPPLAVYTLLQNYNVPNKIIEPCAGRGHISTELIRNGHDVKSYDLNEYEDPFCKVETGKDFLTLEKPYEYDGLITNPPYYKGLPLQMLKKAVDEYSFVAFFLRLTFLEGKSRKEFFDKYPPSSIMFLSDRVKFSENTYYPIEKQDQIGGMIAYMWLIYDKNEKYDPYKWIKVEDYYDDWRLNFDNHRMAT